MSFLESIGLDLFTVIAQIFNFLLLFWIFKRFLGDTISTSIEERRNLVKKLKNADVEYLEILDKAKIEAEDIISHAKKHSESILYEGETLAKEHSKTILKEGEQKAKAILLQAEKEAKKLEESLTNNWTDSLKRTSKMLVKKILGSDEKLQDKYLDTLISDLKK
ncbi:ATP synthase subunit b [candidate division SR1 bacterium RAAC1_SR1_1]|nr:ATP synthase subunit b [candidate division SR1 bacterium RAAC1_SR1_1]